MKDRERWTPSKFVVREGRLRASRDRAEVSSASRGFADRVAAFYDRVLPRYARGRLVDLGCGKVPLYGRYGPLVDEVICVDWGASPHGPQHLDYECDLAQPLPLADASFDTVILSDVLEHVPEPALLLREIGRILAPGGTVLISVPFYCWIHEEPHDFYRYTEFALDRLVVQAGLVTRELERFGGVPEILADVVAKSSLRVPKVGAHLAAVVQGVAGVAGRFGPLAFVSHRTSRAFPFGYGLVAQRPAQPHTTASTAAQTAQESP